jgi:hypothetical protein
MCELSIKETALATLIHSVLLRHHAEGMALPRREQWVRQTFENLTPKPELHRKFPIAQPSGVF